LSPWTSVFQSTHPHGVRLTPDALYPREKMFQSTHPHGVRPPCQPGTPPRKRFQSTHPHGVRRKRGGKHELGLRGFNPRTRTGCDQPSRWYLLPVFVFQSTHPHGVRPTPSVPFSAIRCFNPRTRTGCDSRKTGSPQRAESFNPRTRTGCDGNGRKTL